MKKTVIKLTLDTNCIIDIEENRPDSKYLSRLLDYHNKHLVSIGIPTVIASEKQRNGTFADNDKRFRQKIEDVIENAEQLKTMLIWGMGYWGDGIFAGEKEENLKNKIQNILFPDIEYIDKNKDKKRFTKWRNAMCDILIIWTHIFYNREVFITRDKNFLKKINKQQLIELGAKQILSPRDALTYIEEKIK